LVEPAGEPRADGGLSPVDGGGPDGRHLVSRSVGMEGDAEPSASDSGGSVDGGLPRCSAIEDRALAFGRDQRNQIVIEAPCAPPDYSGPGRVRRIERGELTGVHLIDVVLDAPCEGYDAPASLSILFSGVDWGLAVGSEVRVEVIGPVVQRINGGSGGALVWLPDGSLMAAYYHHTAEQLPRFLDRLGLSAAFEPECRDDFAPDFVCQRSTIREALVLPTESVRLNVYQSTRISRSGATFHLALTNAIEWLGYNAPCSWYPSDDPGEGRLYRLFMVRVP
jgi:hypothetical protein